MPDALDLVGSFLWDRLHVWHGDACGQHHRCCSGMVAYMKFEGVLDCLGEIGALVLTKVFLNAGQAKQEAGAPVKNKSPAATLQIGTDTRPLGDLGVFENGNASRKLEEGAVRVFVIDLLQLGVRFPTNSTLLAPSINA